MRRLSRAIEFRSRETWQHIERMGELSALLAGRLGFERDYVEMIRIAAPMHDVGKVAVPDAVLLKPGPLDAQERADMERHTVIGHDVLSGSDTEVIQLAASIALTHHERFDGGGYPAGIAGLEIPVEGRIAAVADVFDALTSDRVYRKALPVERALEIVEEGRGTQFDPLVAERLLESMDEVDADPPRPLGAGGRLALGVLRPVHRPIGVLQERGRGVGPVAAQRDADAGLERASLAVASVGSRSAALTRSTSCSASPGPVTFSRTSTNSSPPHRATVSLGRDGAQDAPPAARSARSPASWPCSSLISLKPSRSMNSTAMRWSLRLDAARACSSRSSSSARLARPVSGSWRASWALRARVAPALDRDAGEMDRLLDETRAPPRWGPRGSW